MEVRRKFQHYSKEFIAEVLAELESGVSRRVACEKRGLDGSLLCGWVSRYGSEALRNMGKPSFTEQQRRGIVRKILGGEMTIQEAMLAHTVAKNTLRNWIRQSKAEETDIDSKQSAMPASNDSLAQDLQNARLKILALETLIDVAEEELKIKIRKKPGAKQ